MLRLTLLVTSLLSFIYFLNPKAFAPVKNTGEKVLGIQSLNQTINAETVRTALLIHCINTGNLPTKLNELYENELKKEKYLDLDKNFAYIPAENCDFELSPK